MDDAAALKRLNLLLGEDGALKIITPFHACAGKNELLLDKDVAAAGDDSETAQHCKAHAEKHGHTTGMPGGYTNVGHYRLVSVKRLEPTEGKPGNYTAYGDDPGGTQCSGAPAALLARLTEHERG
jgi:hypothetical protein